MKPQDTTCKFSQHPILWSIMVLIIVGYLSAAAGCGKKPAGRGQAVPAGDYLAKALAATAKARAYRYSGSGSIDYLDVSDHGTFKAAGEYKNPAQAHQKTETRLGRAIFFTETLYKNKNFYLLTNEMWKKTPFDPNTLMQPGYKLPNLILDQLAHVADRPVFVDDTSLDGRKMHVITASAGPRKLKQFLQQQFNQAAAIEPERREGLTNFLRQCTISQDYIIYIDPLTQQVTKIVFHQVAKLDQTKPARETKLSVSYTLTDFGRDVEMPSLSKRSK